MSASRRASCFDGWLANDRNRRILLVSRSLRRGSLNRTYNGHSGPTARSSERATHGWFLRDQVRAVTRSVPTTTTPTAHARITKLGASNASTSSQSNMRFGARSHGDGTTTVTETVTVRETTQKTYPQNWPAYNAAQTHEK